MPTDRPVTDPLKGLKAQLQSPPLSLSMTIVPPTLAWLVPVDVPQLDTTNTSAAAAARILCRLILRTSRIDTPVSFILRSSANFLQSESDSPRLLGLTARRAVKDPLLRHLQRGGHGALKDGVLAERRDHHPRPKREQLAELVFDRAQQQVSVAPDPSAQDHELRVEDRHDRGDRQ